VPDTLRDSALTLLAIAGAAALVFLSRALARSGGLAPALHRKVLHAAVGIWTLALTPMFHHLGWALVAPVLFGLLNASGKARDLMPGMAETPREARGLWTLPLAVALTYVLFWEESPRPAILAGVAALALADPAASLVGSRWGQRRLRPSSGGRTLEGSLVFFLVTALSTWLVALAMDGGASPWRMGIGCGFVGAVVEALTPSGWDNLTIPLAVAAAYRFLA
jgi:dolichol kinase